MIEILVALALVGGLVAASVYAVGANRQEGIRIEAARAAAQVWANYAVLHAATLQTGLVERRFLGAGFPTTTADGEDFTVVVHTTPSSRRAIVIEYETEAGRQRVLPVARRQSELGR